MTEATNVHYGDDAPAIIIADDAAAGRAAIEAATLAGARAVGPIGWADAAGRIAQQAVVGLAVIEAHGVDDARIDALLPGIAAAAQAHGAPAVVSIAAPQIDAVAAHMLGEGVDILCDPDPATRVAATALALAPLGRDPMLHDVAREGEALRLQRLNEEVARIAETLARLTRDGARAPTSFRPAGAADRTVEYDGPPADAPPIAVRDLRAAIQSRRLRDKYLPGGLFEDPAWDMLLDLFAAELERTQVSVSSLCIAAAVAPTTALRWIGKLTEADLLQREADPFDRRRAFMRLSDRARTGMRRYFAAIQAAGLPIA